MPVGPKTVIEEEMGIYGCCGLNIGCGGSVRGRALERWLASSPWTPAKIDPPQAERKGLLEPRDSRTTKGTQ